MFTEYQGKRLKLLECKPSNVALTPGQVFCKKDAFEIGCSGGSLHVSLLQLEGKKALDAKSFLAGHKEFCSSTLPS